MSEIILTAVSNGIFKSNERSISFDLLKYGEENASLSTPKGTYEFRMIRKGIFPSYSTFYIGFCGGIKVTAEVIKRTAVITW